MERMIAAGARQICMVISAEKSDIVRYYAERDYAAEIFYAVQRRPRGLCDALFRAESFVRSDEPVLIGLPDTIWFPENAFHASVEQGPGVNLVLFPVDNPSAFDAVLCDDSGRVERVEVKQPNPGSHWIWGAVTASGRAFHDLLSALGVAPSRRTNTWAICSTPTSPPATRFTPPPTGSTTWTSAPWRAIAMRRITCARADVGQASNRGVARPS